jgi:hypothetical protein
MTRSFVRPVLAAMTAVCCNISPVLAQRAVYTLTGGDTLRFHETTKIDGVVRGAAGDNTFSITRESTIAFAFMGGESVQASYDALVVEASGAMGGQKANGEELLHQPFVLHMEPNGRVQTIHSPSFPRSVRLIAQLPPQFDDFFLRLPVPGGPLEIGTVWVDTTTLARNDSAGQRLSVRRIGHYRVERDSVVGNRPAVVVNAHTELRFDTSTPMQQSPFVSSLLLTGDEDSIVLFSVAEGRMLGRERTGELHGVLTYKGGDEPFVVNQSYKFHGSISAVDAPGHF